METPKSDRRKYDESVLVVPREVLQRVCPQTFCDKPDQAIAAMLTGCSFLDRNLAEHDPRHKQVIPYVVIRHAERYLLIRRTNKQGESRLHDMYSLGIGGHINDSDADGTGQYGHIIATGMRRELTEEIGVEGEESCRLIGIINDDSTEVARVHVGLVYLLTTSSPEYTIVEEDKYTASWKLPAEMAEYYEGMESWAQIVHDYLLASQSAERTKKWEGRV